MRQTPSNSRLTGLLGLSLGLGLSLVPGSPVWAKEVSAQVLKETAEGDLGRSTLECSLGAAFWYVDITLESTAGPISTVAGVVVATSGHLKPFGGRVNPPTETYYDQVQIPRDELESGTYIATATGTGTVLESVYVITGPTCEITIPE